MQWVYNFSCLWILKRMYTFASCLYFWSVYITVHTSFSSQTVMNVVGLLKFDISLTYQKFTGRLRMVWGPIGGSMDAKAWWLVPCTQQYACLVRCKRPLRARLPRYAGNSRSPEPGWRHACASARAIVQRPKQPVCLQLNRLPIAISTRPGCVWTRIKQKVLAPQEPV